MPILLFEPAFPAYEVALETDITANKPATTNRENVLPPDRIKQLLL